MKNKLDWNDWPKVAKDLGHYNMRILADGTWLHEGRPIKRESLVKLFASVLRRDAQGQYWLNTPVEKGLIDVDDAPFVIGTLAVSEQDGQQVLICTTNVEDDIVIGPDHPLVMRLPIDGEVACPYVEVRNGLWAKMQRNAYYQLVDLADECDDRLVVHSLGQTFDLGAMTDT